MSLSNTIFLVVLPSGNRAVYDVQPQHINGPENMLAERARDYGTQLAVEIAGQWYKPGAHTLIDDPRTIALLNRTRKA